jgi:DNA-directed RNA polymerase subunit RPC12/RpoP
MKFLCLDCDEPMKLHTTEGGPRDDSLTAVFRCPECGFRVAMLTNPLETQMVRSLGVKVGGRTAPAAPFEHLRAAMAGARPDAFAGTPTGATEGDGPGCPFAAMVSDTGAAETPGVAWTAEAEARLERVPAFIRPMARKAIERYAEGKGYPAVTEVVMDEARGVMGM